MIVGRGKTCTGDRRYSRPLPGQRRRLRRKRNLRAASTRRSTSRYPATSGAATSTSTAPTRAADDRRRERHRHRRQPDHRPAKKRMLGLIANNFVRIYHPVTLVHPKSAKRCGHRQRNLRKSPELRECTGNASGTRRTTSTIEAAMLAINHSFIVDNYNCGAPLGHAERERRDRAELPRRRRHRQRQRNTGYIKNYDYDDRLKRPSRRASSSRSNPTGSIGRETESAGRPDEAPCKRPRLEAR